MFSAPGPIEEVTAKVACRRLGLANAVAAWTRACSLRPVGPPEGRGVGRPRGGQVDVPGPGADLRGAPPGPCHIWGEDAGAQAIGSAVGLRDGAFPIVGRADRHGRAEQLLLAKRRPRV